MKCIIVFLITILTLLTACDPLRRIKMKNRSGHDAEITWIIKQDSINQSPFFISSALDVKFDLKPQQPANEINMSFGVGTWTPKVVQNLVDDLDSVIIRGNKGVISIKGEEEIKKFLLARRKGFAKDKIEIRIN